MYITGTLHMTQNIVLQIGDRLKQIGHILVLLNIADNLSRLGMLIEVDEMGRRV
jgi:hypothetical protein